MNSKGDKLCLWFYMCLSSARKLPRCSSVRTILSFHSDFHEILNKIKNEIRTCRDSSYLCYSSELTLNNSKEMKKMNSHCFGWISSFPILHFLYCFSCRWVCSSSYFNLKAKEEIQQWQKSLLNGRLLGPTNLLSGRLLDPRNVPEKRLVDLKVCKVEDWWIQEKCKLEDCWMLKKKSNWKIAESQRFANWKITGS